MTEGKTETEVGESYIGLCIRESRKNRNKSTCIGGQLRVQHCAWYVRIVFTGKLLCLSNGALQSVVDVVGLL